MIVAIIGATLAGFLMGIVVTRILQDELEQEKLDSEYLRGYTAGETHGIFTARERGW